MEAATGAITKYKPALSGGVFQAAGNHSPVIIPGKGKYTFVDFVRNAKCYSVPLNMNPQFPITRRLQRRVAIGLQTTNGKALPQAEFNVHELLAPANSQTTKYALKAATQAAVERDVFGAPAFFSSDQMFCRQDRLDFVAEALQIASS